MAAGSKLPRYGETRSDVAVDCRATLAMTIDRHSLILDCFALLAMTAGLNTLRHGEERSDVAILN